MSAHKYDQQSVRSKALLIASRNSSESDSVTDRPNNFKELGYEIVQLSEYVMSGKAFYRRVTAQGIGPGGWRCPCCAPAPGAAKRMWMRMGKKKMNRLFSALVEDDLKESRK